MADQDQETSLRDEILAAADEVDASEEETVSEQQTQPEEKAAEETPQEVPEETVEEPELAAAPEPEPQIKPPVDWPAEVASKFAELPSEVQQAIHNREVHINDVLQQSSEARNAVGAFTQMFQPYVPLMQAEGVSDPLQAVEGLLKTTAQLAMGTPQQKAERIAGLINHYGIDIQMLDSVLAGAPAQDPQTSQFEQMLDQRLAPVNQLISRVQQLDQQTAQQSQAEAAKTIEAFAADPKNAHFAQVKNVMADFLDMAAAQGRQMTMEEAYMRACMADPSIADQVMAERSQALAADGQQAAQKARNAASSLKGNAAGVDPGIITDDMSLRDTIAAQVEGDGRI
jgi:hypothetical protein